MQGSSEACLPKKRLKKARKIQFSRFRKKNFLLIQQFSIVSQFVFTQKN